jgi:hypothetical protein
MRGGGFRSRLQFALTLYAGQGQAPLVRFALVPAHVGGFGGLVTGYRCRRLHSRAVDVRLVKLLVDTSSVRLTSAGGGHCRWVNTLLDTRS